KLKSAISITMIPDKSFKKIQNSAMVQRPENETMHKPERDKHKVFSAKNRKCFQLLTFTSNYINIIKLEKGSQTGH
ncbi:hypothetical protein VIGAN_04345800, partial [Vigna angularis var. angularis]